ncbi:hypothetical protein BH20ACI4_BH20ACI4_17350 [soil metagenome]
MREENIKIVESYIEAIGKKDLSFEMLDDEIHFEDPMTVKSQGVENLRAFLTGFLPAIHSVKIIEHICENDTVVTHWEVDGIFGIIPILEKFRVENGKITEAIAFFDPRPILGS